MPVVSVVSQAPSSQIAKIPLDIHSTLGGDLVISVYDLPSRIPSEMLQALSREAIRTNVVLPHLEKARLREDTGEIDDNQLWITCTSKDDKGFRTPELILSCTRSELGEYPIFIAPLIPASFLTEEFLVPRLRLLMIAMNEHIQTGRVYSIFAPQLVAELFAEMWFDMKGIDHYSESYYAAKLTFCTKRTFRNRQATDAGLRGRYVLRPAVMTDLEGVAQLCFQFASESEPFILDAEGALREAQMLIVNKQVWVHELQPNPSLPPSTPSSGSQIACLVAFTRNSQTCATISKVVTSPDHRGMGCAQRLMRQVCKHLLNSGKQAVALYVAHNNVPATKVYHNVGFVGLGEADNQPIEGVERWSEIGFDRNRVQLGHW